MLAIAASCLPVAAQMTVSLSPSQPSPAPLGTVVTWNASVWPAQHGTLSYRFRTRLLGTGFRTVVDYGPKSSFDWATIAREGPYEIEVSAQNNDTGEIVSATSFYRLESLALSRLSIVTPTRYPQVFIYSASPCPTGQRMKVEFRSDEVSSTPFKACHTGVSMNFYLAGMRANTVYYAHYILDTGSELIPGPEAAFATGYVPLKPPDVSLLTNGSLPTTNGILLQSLFGTASIATDLQGNVIWFSPGDITFLTRPVDGGTFLGIGENEFLDPSKQFMREFDLAGNTVAETNAARINQQLTALNVHPINAFHHEARKLPNGSYLVLANSERMLTDVQGPGAVDVVGDTILILNPDLQVIWAWDAFDHIDPHLKAVQGETCVHPSGAACAPWYLAPKANDWLHGNSLQLTPDGDILYSIVTAPASVWRQLNELSSPRPRVDAAVPAWTTSAECPAI